MIKEEQEQKAEEIEFQVVFGITTKLEEDDTQDSIKEYIKKELRSFEKHLEEHDYVDSADGEISFSSEGEFIFKPTEGQVVEGSSIPDCTCGGFYSRVRRCTRCRAPYKKGKEDE